MTSSTKKSQFYDKLYHRKPVLRQAVPQKDSCTSCATESQFYEKLCHKKPVLWPIVPQKASFMTSCITECRSFMTLCSTESQFYDNLYSRILILQVVPQSVSFMTNSATKYQRFNLYRSLTPVAIFFLCCGSASNRSFQNPGHGYILSMVILVSGSLDFFDSLWFIYVRMYGRRGEVGE